MNKSFTIWKKEIDQYIINVTGQPNNDILFNYQDFYDEHFKPNIVAFLLIYKNKNNYKNYDNYKIWKYDYQKYSSLINENIIKNQNEIKYDNIENNISFSNNINPLEKCLSDMNLSSNFQSQ